MSLSSFTSFISSCLMNMKFGKKQMQLFQSTLHNNDNDKNNSIYKLFTLDIESEFQYQF